MDENKIKTVCKLGAGSKTCRYLSMAGGELKCVKNTELKSLLDARVNSGEMKAQGDNCEGE